MKTLLEVLQSGTKYLEGRGVEDARLNMEHLAAKVLGCARLDLYLDFDRPLGDDELAPLRDLLRRRGERVPLQHLLGEVEFYGRSFISDSRALVPRPETEELVAILLKRYAESPPESVVDVGCGSGVIGLTLAAEWPDARVALVDLSDEALQLAGENAARLELGDVELFSGDLLSGLSAQFDLVVANLPYVGSEEFVGLQDEVRHDPQAALDGGTGGTQLIRRLIEAVPDRLTPGGLLALEIGEGQAAAVAAMAADAGLRGVERVKDLGDFERFVLALR